MIKNKIVHSVQDFSAKAKARWNKFWTTPYGSRLGIFGKLTHGWLWSDNPIYGEIDDELRRKGM